MLCVNFAGVLKDSARPAYWAPDEEITHCCVCEKEFSIKLPIHHCRDCGQGVCDVCSPARKPVPLRGWDYPVRVCMKCEKKKKKHWHTFLCHSKSGIIHFGFVWNVKCKSKTLFWIFLSHLELEIMLHGVNEAQWPTTPHFGKKRNVLNLHVLTRQEYW